MTGRRALARVGVLLCALAAILVAPGVAQARTASLTSVSEVDRHAVLTWTMPKGVVGRFVEIAKFSPELSPNGHFRQRNITGFTVLEPDQTSVVVDDFPLSNGTYYVHVGTEDTLNRDLCPGREYSNILKLDVPGGGTTAGIGGPGCVPSITTKDPGASGGHGGDNTAPGLSLSYKRKQRVKGLVVKAKVDEAASLTATGTVAIPGASKRKAFRIITVSRQVAANVTTTLRLKLNKRDLKVAKRLLKQRRKLKARVTITAVDPFFNSYVARRTIRLKL